MLQFIRLLLKNHHQLLSNNELHIIIQGCINQDRRNQQDFYKIFYGYAAAVCVRYTQTNDDLVEIVNDGFMKVFTQLNVFRVPAENCEAILRSWIKRIMVTTSIDYYRKYIKNEPKLVDVDDKEDAFEVHAETPIEKLTFDEVLNLVQQLSPTCKVVFNMYVIDGLTHEEIAKELGVSITASKSSLLRARKNIMKLIEIKNKTLV